MLLNLIIDEKTGAIRLEKNLDLVQELSAAQVAWLIKAIMRDFVVELRKIENNKTTGRKMPGRNRYGSNE